jgi:outer membrane protein insertion porin family
MAQGDAREDVVWKVIFEGNEAYSNMILSQIIATSQPNFFQRLFGITGDYHLNEAELRRDRVRIERFYQHRAYHQVNVDYEIEENRKPWRKVVRFSIRENNPIRINTTSIIIEGDEQTKKEIREARDFLRASERHDYRPGRRYQQIRLPDVEGQFMQMLENLGYAWPEVEVSADVDSTANLADIHILLKPNSKTFFTEFIIEGDLSVPERVLTRHTDIRLGDEYSGSQMQTSQRAIFNHHLFRFATITIPEQEKDSTLTALIRVREYPKRTVQAAIGVGREEIVRGQLSWQHRNISSTGHRYGANLRASFIEQRAGTDYLIPYVFNSKSTSVTSLYGLHRLEPSFELLQAGLNSSLIYQIQRNKTASISYEYSFNDELSREQGVRLPRSFRNYNISSFTISGYYNEGFSREPRGWFVQPSIEISSTFGEADFRFQKLNLDVRRFTPLSNTTTLATRVNSGTIFYSQSSELPGNIRYFTGGTNSVRGWNRRTLGPSLPVFDENGNFLEYVPVGGRTTFSFNIEVRQNLGNLIPKLGLAAFLDGGQVWEKIETMDERPLQFGAGGGIRYQSPIGPIRVDVAYKLNPTDEDLNIFDGKNFGSGWNRIGIHFSIGQAF